MSAMFHINFRFSQGDLAQLDKIVSWERSKGPMLLPHMQPNRTSVLKALISREILRLNEEEDRMLEKLRGVKNSAREVLDRMENHAETPKERKARLQRDRRRAARLQSA